jgi:hypothetical protein
MRLNERKADTVKQGENKLMSICSRKLIDANQLVFVQNDARSCECNPEQGEDEDEDDEDDDDGT